MVDITSFGTGAISAIIAIALVIFAYFRKYKTILLSIRLDKLDDAFALFLHAISDLKLTTEEKLAIAIKLHDAIDVEMNVVKIAQEEITTLKPDKIIHAIKIFYPDVSIKAVSDGEYFTIPESKWREIIKNDFVEKKKYLHEKFDCDDYARCFVSHVVEHYRLNSVGIVWGWFTKEGYHAWNFIFTAEEKLLWFEPQNDKLFEPSGEKFNYEAKEIFF